MRRFRICNPISCITYRFGVLIFIKRPILVFNARKIMKCANTFVRVGYIYIYIYMYIYIYKRASLACAARLADTLCPPEASFGRLEVRLVNYKGDIISKYVHLSFKIDITLKITKFVNF